MPALLEVQNLNVAYYSSTGVSSPALLNLTFAVRPAEVLCVLGESGSGKSTLAASLLGLLPPNGKITSGKVFFEGQDLLQTSELELEQIRGKRISLIFQEPSVALHAAMRVADQIAEVLRAHESMDSATLRNKTRQTLSLLFRSDTERFANSYPHQLSGGQKQRVLIAQAIACGPSLVIADEPTAFLDAATRSETLLLLKELREALGIAMILITHDPAVVASLGDRVLILYGGRLVEWGPTRSVISSPQHPYTQALLRCLPPDLNESNAQRKTKLPVIGGESARPSFAAVGCVFEQRCADRMEVCSRREPVTIAVSKAQAVSCFKFGG
jgi:peptide/nickel transport system ATP-binding protein